MASDFQPFVTPRPAANEAPGFRVKLVSASTDAEPSFVACPTPHPARPSSAAAPAAPVVTLRREGDRVTGIRVQCTCGQVIDLECVY